jgi:myo-inositol-1(or 4)-monophosphatase
MPRDSEWLQVLNRCKRRVQQQIRPLLANARNPQPDLGIGAGGDPMKQIDLAAEEAIVDTLKEHKISFTLISEESGFKEYGQNPNECYVTADPIDGTTNLTRGIPFYATSIAISTKPMLGTVHAALVADLFHDVTYKAQKGRGAYRNKQKICPSESSSLEEAVIGIDLNSYRVQRIASQLTRLIQKTKHIRHLGANALELCYVADGTTEGFVDIRGKLRSTDMAAAWLIIKEAGAEITSPNSDPLDVKLSPKQKVEFIASANPRIHMMMLDLIKKKKEKK